MEFLIILLLVILNGIFAMYEMALVSSNKTRLETLVSKGNKRAKGVLKQLKDPEKYLSTIQIGITLIGIVSGAYGGANIADDLVPLFSMIPGAEPYATKLAMATTVVIITYLSLIIGELVPKTIALSSPERYATLISPLIIVLSKISYPFVYLLSASTKLVNSLMGMKDNEERPMTQDELKMILHQSSEQGVIDKDETEMLRDVFRFSDKRANDLMTYRREIVALHPTDTPEEVLKTIREQHFSRHDLTESIFGDILEENETEEQDIVVRQDGSMLVEASMNLDDFMEAMGIMEYDDLKEEDFTTLSGLAMFLIGRVPKAGDLFDYKTLHFEVVDMDRGRVDKLLVTKEVEESDEEADKE